MNELATPAPAGSEPEAELSADARAAQFAQQVGQLRDAVIEKLTYSVGKDRNTASERDWFISVALATRDHIVNDWMRSVRAAYQENRRRVYYLSLEFLIGRLLIDSLTNLGLVEQMRAALSSLDMDLDKLRQVEPDAALGNGGLGRLAACFMESMATLSIAGHGYGIRYDNGMFRQTITDGWQHEYPEDWLDFGNPWEFPRPEVAHNIGFGGVVDAMPRDNGSPARIWRPSETVVAAAYDTPIVGWPGADKSNFVNTLRLWSARAPDPLRLDVFNEGDYVGALADQVRAESISKILYPADSTPAGQELRLRQEYFFASASLQDLIRRHLRQNGDIDALADYVVIQLNDTHPAIAVAEMMRLLVDVYVLDWDRAWEITQATFCYTNHTLLPEALETWPAPLMERLLPRHMQIIYLINARHLDRLRAEGMEDPGKLSALSLIDEHHGRHVRMGHLAFLGSHKVNGVSALHTELVKQTVFRDFNEIYPDRIVNKTNGVTFRRWLLEANPHLTKLLAETIGKDFYNDAEALKALEPLATDLDFQARFAGARLANKTALAGLIADRMMIKVDPNAIFDVQIKRIHEYKRQLLNILQTIAHYNDIRAHPMRDCVPRVKIFAGKAAASYHMAKLIIKLANDVARVVNNDPTVRDLLKVVFLPNYNVSLAEAIIPAADLSEQISTAGMEASGTGNMKMALNGALTIGTLDGANVEIREHVGADNICIFGLTAEEVAVRRARGNDARDTIAASPMLREVLESIRDGAFSPDDRNRYATLVDMLTYHDYFLVTADFDAYCATQMNIARRWRDRKSWWRSAILNTARTGWFSSDRTIAEYADDIWKVPVRPS
ncbi:glycogen/starch/alpha-glucan phosphorylase [Rhodoblastus acidophilus]|uniref:Alpha-1,4 glucan phosphorylase n=1 Tax=Candidatus Rhodoblastus alkanivorans TaxID=2954117 RepID=A0ABS9Z7B5_9HYPH|nr:glycogen/starch/alpha-glucan phosphorylase [Candidatus Rhodoblastus alkanivorans]MCI4678717.1 glycogen/starch/alpha-glucan phosphorylase [Candidatus Rhodoblastus alkanivorans]MCI4683487.1 glycogen/starch/alpha-glucan phosphorylase [Candidatus Rhodoblastus alkanivorans]MDI4640801.1 glycogen/starch/alpha-glucan phosphorylase [Rhodoblastus acidophilus]